MSDETDTDEGKEVTETADTGFVRPSKVKEFLKAKGLRTAGNASEALNKQIEGLLLRAADRCKGNGRQTVKPEDM